MTVSPEELMTGMAHMPTDMELLTTAYGIMGALGIAAYIPQMLALWNDRSGSKNVPLTTWLLWGAQTVVYFMYALLVNKDPMFITLMLLTMLATHGCLYLLLYNRFIRKVELNRRADDPPADPQLNLQFDAPSETTTPPVETPPALADPMAVAAKQQPKRKAGPRKK